MGSVDVVMVVLVMEEVAVGETVVLGTEEVVMEAAVVLATEEAVMEAAVTVEVVLEMEGVDTREDVRVIVMDFTHPQHQNGPLVSQLLQKWC
jgi:hypothetical protein